MLKPTWKTLLPIACLVFAIMACTLNLGGPPYPNPEIPISTEAVGQMKQDLEVAAAAGALSGQMQLVFSETGLSSLLYFYLEQQEAPFFTKPQVYLRENQIRIHGTAEKGGLQAYIYIVMTAGADDQGNLALEMTSADFGPLPVPDGLLAMFTAAITEAYTGALGPVATGYRIESVIISDGFMLLTVRTR